MNCKKGLFIVLEGGDGTGKTTQANLLSNYLKNLGYSTVLTREPGGVDSAEKIRDIILHDDIDPITEALLFASARREHLVKKVIPALNEGKIVICDRFLYSSLAYQGYARGLGIEEVYNLNKIAIDNYLPDLTIMFNLSEKEGIKRIFENRNSETNRLDKESLEFHSKVRIGYDIVSNMFSDRIALIDASKSIEDVFEDIKAIINDKLSKK